MKRTNLSWQVFGQNVLLYFLSLVILITAFRILHYPWLMVFMWIVAMGGIIVLALQANRLANSAETVTVTGQMKAKLQQARNYRAKIIEALNSANQRGTQTAHREALQSRVEYWTSSIEMLIARVDEIQQDAILRKDMKTVPATIKKIEKELAAETDPAIREQLERTLETRRKQLHALESLQHSARRAELQVDNTLSLLGTIYSQVLTSQSSTHVANYARLTEEVDEEVLRLEDHLAALQEVTAG